MKSFVVHGNSKYNNNLIKVMHYLWTILPTLYIIFHLDVRICILLPLGYISENIHFLLFHYNLHAKFLEKNYKSSDYVYAAYLHHYVNPQIFSLLDYYVYMIHYIQSLFVYYTLKCFMLLYLLDNDIAYVYI